MGISRFSFVRAHTLVSWASESSATRVPSKASWSIASMSSCVASGNDLRLTSFSISWRMGYARVRA